jgi:hypothetical protein
MPWARASSLHRFMACPAASWLPRWDDSKGVIKRPYLLSSRVPLLNESLLEIRDKRAADLGRKRHAEKERGELYPEGYHGQALAGWHELSVSYCCLTGDVRWFLHSNEHARDLWKSMQCEHSVTGTADWMGILKDGSLWVDDLKTGWRTPEVLTPQTLLYSMCLHDLATQAQWGKQFFLGNDDLLRYSLEPAVPGKVLVSITHQPRGKGVPTREGLWRTATPLMLESFRLDLHEAWRVTTLDKRPRAGEHCTWCPSAAWCSAAQAA